ncbi:MAG: SH3 domain-containing protein, partial [Ruminococcus sp.]|nr:SH3 domain-containing protein [Ruminococcus sp.]
VVTAKKSGSVDIKATSGTKSATCKITVKSGSTVNISTTSISNMRRGKSVLLKSTTGSVKWKSSNTEIATVNNGIVDTKSNGYVTITAYTSSGAATCLINVIGRDNIRFVYASPNSAPKNSTVTFKAITDTDRVAVRFVVSNGSTSYTVNATNKVKDGDNYIWSGSKKLSKSGKWTVKAYAKYKTSTGYLTTPGNGEGEVFVTSSTDKITTVCAERRASDEVINLIANYEGFLTCVTADSITSDPTLGYGKVVLTNEQFYNNLTKNEAYAYLCQTVNKGGYTTKTNSFLLDNGIKFNQQQFDSLVCFTYNVGASAIYNDSDLQSVLLNTGSGSSTIKAGASGYVNASEVNLRSGAGTNYSVLTCMSQNTKFTFVDGRVYNSDWYKIKLSNGTTGYIYKSYASVSGGSRDLNNVNKQSFLDNYLQYHHAAGSCYWGLLYRRVDEAEIFFYADYQRDGEYNKKGFKFNCGVRPSFGIG